MEHLGRNFEKLVFPINWKKTWLPETGGGH